MFRIIIASIIIFIVLTGAVYTQSIDYVGSTLWTGPRDIQIVDGNAFCAFANGFIIFDISEPTEPLFISQAYCGGGDLIHVNDNLAVVTDLYNRINLLDITDIENPSLLGTYQATDRIFDLFVAGDYVYIIAGEEHGSRDFRIIDFSNPGNPFLAGSYQPTTRPYSVWVINEYAYITKQDGLLILNVENPDNPVVESIYDIGYATRDLYILNNLAYITAEGLTIINISNPANPEFVGRYINNQWASYRLRVSGDLAFVSEQSIIGPEYPTRMRAYDISDPTYPTVAGDSDLGDGSHMRFDVDGYYFYRIYGFDIVVYDLSDVYWPILIAEFGTYYPIFDIFIHDDYAFLASQNLSLVDISNPFQPSLIQAEDDYGNIGKMFYSNGLLFATGADFGLKILDISNPLAPVIVGEYGGQNTFNDMFVLGNHAYLVKEESDSSGLHIVNCYDASNPFIEGLFEFSSWHNIPVFVMGNHAFLCFNSNLYIVDISNAENPSLISTCHLYSGSSRGGIYAEGSHVYIKYTRGLCIVDISNIEDPHIQEMNPYMSDCRDMFVQDDKIYLAGERIAIIDITDPEEPALIINQETPNIVENIYVSGEYIYTSCNSFMIFHYDSQVGIIEKIQAPEQYLLSQNCPNPFNASTTIKYQLPNQSHVKIDIYDILGRKVASLINRQQLAGYHQAIWHADDFSSGMYFYKLQAKDYNETRRMILVK